MMIQQGLQAHRLKVTFSLGGIDVQINFTSSWHRNHQFDLAEVSVFLYKKNRQNYDVKIFFSKLKEAAFSKAERILSIQQKNVLLKTDRENFVFYSYVDREKKSNEWLIGVDDNFFIFKYFFIEKPKLDCNIQHLIFNRFLLQHTFINHHGLIIHAAGGSINGKGMVFPAISGTGKSTLSHLLLPFPENQLFSEERIIMRRLDDGWHLWGTPWKGTGVIARNESAPLNALVFLSQAPETKITPLSTSVALRRLLETVSIPWYSQEWTDKGLAVCESLLRDVPAFELAFRPDETAVQAVAELAASLD